MKRTDWIIWCIGAGLLLLVLIVSGCKTTSEAESHMAASAANTLDSQGTLIEERTTTAPIRIVTETTTATGVKRTRTVTLAPVATSRSTADLKSQERGDSTLSSESETKSSFDFLHSPFALLGGLVALAGVAFAAFKILKPRLLP